MLSLLVLATIVAAGCDGAVPPSITDGGPGDASAAASFDEELIERLGGALCAVHEQCTPGSAAQVHCHDARELVRHAIVPLLAEESAAGRVAVDATGLAACVEVVSTHWMRCSIVRLETPQRWLDRCRALVRGTLALGEDCVQSWQCSAGAYCERASTSSGCGGTCAPQRANDERCGRDDECEGACLFGVCGAPSTSESPAPVVVGPGERCDATATGGRGVCTDGWFCAGTIGMIERYCVGPAERDGECLDAMPDMCPEPQLCDTRLGEPSLCRNLPRDGERCLRSSSGVRCAAGLACDASERCTPRLEGGAPCEQTAECWSGACDGGRCVPSACGG